jgi:ABC-2 type transport system permease protein
MSPTAVATAPDIAHNRLARPQNPPTLVSHLRAVGAIARKEWIIFRRYPSWMIALLIWPTIIPFGFILTARAFSGSTGAATADFARLAGTTDYAAYILIGSTLWSWLNMTLWDVGYQLRNEQMRGTLESNWLCPTWRISLLLGGSVTKLGISLASLVVTALEFHIVFGIHVLQGNVGLAALVILLLLPSIYGIGLAFGSVVVRFMEANALVFFVRGVFMIFCGMTYPLSVMPPWMQHVAAFLPLTYGTHAIRAAILNNASVADLAPDFVPLLIFAIALPTLSYLAFQQTERRSRQVGALGQY